MDNFSVSSCWVLETTVCWSMTVVFFSFCSDIVSGTIDVLFLLTNDMTDLHYTPVPRGSAAIEWLL